MKPAPMPTVIEYVNGISTIVRNAGRAISMSSSMFLTCCIIRNPTSTSAGTRASDGITATNGASRMVIRNSTPVTTDARPVASSPTPEADWM